MLERQDYNGVIRFKVGRNFLGRAYYFTWFYWVDGLVIDTGCHHCLNEIRLATADLPVQQLVNTHSHEDHIGGNALFQRLGAKVFAHPLALPFLSDPRKLKLHLYRHVFWGQPLPSQGQPIGEVIETEHHVFQVIHTPGHSPDHICLYEPKEGWLFTGDAYVGGKDRALRAGFDVYGIIDSLKRLAALPAKRLFPSCGSVVDDPVSVLARKIAYLEEIGHKVRALHAQGKSPLQIRRELFGPEMAIAYITFGDYSGLNLVKSYLGAFCQGHNHNPGAA